MATKKAGTEEREQRMRVYEVGYLISPSVKEEDVEGVVGGIRNIIEKAEGLFIAEGAASMTRLAYDMEAFEAGKRVYHDRAYFGWIKFEGSTSVLAPLEAALKKSSEVIRHLVFETLREDTRAKIKAPALREVKRGDTLKSTRRTEEASAPVSEEDLDKAIQDLVVE